MDKFVEDELIIQGKTIKVKLGYLNQSNLKFYPENPRIYSLLNVDETEPSQKEIFYRLEKLDHVKQLVQSIKSNKGLIDPIIVREKEWHVLEGNSRLAAYRILAKNDPITWSNIKCQVLPKTIEDSLLFSLLGEYHIIGKKDWAPYEQAGYLYRRHRRHGVPKTTIAKQLNLSVRKISHLINVYQFMLDNKQDEINRWSYYDEYLKSNIIGKVREENAKWDKLIVKKIESKEISRAADVRDKLPKIVKNAGKNLKMFVSEKRSFEAAYESAKSGGAENSIFNRLKNFRKWIANKEIDESIIEMDFKIAQKCKFELEKTKKRVDQLLKRIS